MNQPTLFEIHRRHGALKHALGRVLATANAGASQWLYPWREEFYGLKRKLLERFGERDGTDWQEITRSCWGCEACMDENSYGYVRVAQCDGKGVYSRRYIPLSRWKLGATVFHTPGLAQSEKPDAVVKFRERIAHRVVGDDETRMAFAQLCLWFDRDLFRRVAQRLCALDVPEGVPF